MGEVVRTGQVQGDNIKEGGFQPATNINVAKPPKGGSSASQPTANAPRNVDSPKTDNNAAKSDG
jgi:hypothetical protein